MEYQKKLSPYTSFKIGGPAFCWLEPTDVNEILESISYAQLNNKRLFIIGNGSNLLVQDKGFDGVVLNFGSGFDYIHRETHDIISVGARTSISRLVSETAKMGLSGCEFLSGIPGSLGGAIFMNAGVRDFNNSCLFNEIKDIIIDAEVLDIKNKCPRNFKKEEMSFRYRGSNLDNMCVLGCRIKLKEEKKGIINSIRNRYLKRRAWIKTLGFPTAGSIFKNPDVKTPAGVLIESCGLKGEKIGGAGISNIHANFILNLGGATAKDVLDLIELAMDSVMKKFGIRLELELKVI